MAESPQDKMFIEIYNATYDKVCKYVVSKSGNPADTPDIVQNTYLNVYKSLKKNISIEKPAEYIFKIAKNEINKYYRFKEKRMREIPVFSESENEEQIGSLELEMFLAKELPPDTYVDLNEIWQYIKAQDSLTEKIFVLYFRFDEKLADIAKELGISESNVKNRLYRTIKRIQKEFNLQVADT